MLTYFSFFFFPKNVRFYVCEGGSFNSDFLCYYDTLILEAG